MNKPRCAVIFGQFDAAADPINLPHFRDRLNAAGFETILVDHMDSRTVYDFLKGYTGFRSIAGASLGAGAAPVFAGYIRDRINFVGGFQPSAWDPVMSSVNIPHNPEPITKAVTVPRNVFEALCFRNPIWAMTGGLGHASYVPASLNTKLQVIDRNDPHPGDFGEAQDIMVNKLQELANE